MIICIYIGLLSIKSSLTKSQYQLNLMARDQGATPHTSYTSLVINVIDVNDNTPSFLKSTYTGVVGENSGAGEFVLVISASDNDIGNTFFLFCFFLYVISTKLTFD